MANKKISEFTENTTPAAEDFVGTVDDPSGTPLSRKVTLANLFKAITGLSAETAPATDDEIAIYDITGSAADKMTLSDMLKVISSLTQLALAGGADADKMLIIDGTTPKYMQLDDLLRHGSRLKQTVRYIQPRLIEAATDLTVTNDVGDWRLHIPPDLDGLSLVYAHAEVDAAGTTGTQDFQIRNATDTVDLLSTVMTIDSGETGSDTAATPHVIKSDGSEIVNTNDLIVIDSDVVHTTEAQGLVFTLGFG